MIYLPVLVAFFSPFPVPGGVWCVHGWSILCGTQPHLSPRVGNPFWSSSLGLGTVLFGLPEKDISCSWLYICTVSLPPFVCPPTNLSWLLLQRIASHSSPDVNIRCLGLAPALVSQLSL